MNCNNTNPCPCPGLKCPSHGKCCECIVKHKRAGNVPYCLREIVEEKVSRAIQNLQPTKES